MGAGVAGASSTGAGFAAGFTAGVFAGVRFADTAGLVTAGFGATAAAGAGKGCTGGAAAAAAGLSSSSGGSGRLVMGCTPLCGCWAFRTSGDTDAAERTTTAKAETEEVLKLMIGQGYGLTALHCNEKTSTEAKQLRIWDKGNRAGREVYTSR
jgi:hypothetical protein